MPPPRPWPRPLVPSSTTLPSFLHLLRPPAPTSSRASCLCPRPLGPASPPWSTQVPPRPRMPPVPRPLLLLATLSFECWGLDMRKPADISLLTRPFSSIFFPFYCTFICFSLTSRAALGMVCMGVRGCLPSQRTHNRKARCLLTCTCCRMPVHPCDTLLTSLSSHFLRWNHFPTFFLLSHLWLQSQDEEEEGGKVWERMKGGKKKAFFSS